MKGKKGSSKYETVPCEICSKQFDRYTKPSLKKPCRTCSSECRRILRTQIFSGERNPAFGKAYRTKVTHPEWAARVSQTSTERHINAGDSNGMKSPENREKARISANRKWATRPDLIENIRLKSSKNWADGKYEGVRVGQCEWHSLILNDGHEIKLQGTWELAYARWMDECRIPFESHVGRLPYTDDSGVKRSYYPDFRVANGSYVDVKNPYYEKLHARKLELVCEQNNVIIRIVNRQEMERLGLI